MGTRKVAYDGLEGCTAKKFVKGTKWVMAGVKSDTPQSTQQQVLPMPCLPRAADSEGEKAPDHLP